MNALFGEEKNVPFEKKYQIEIDLIRSPRWDNIGCENFLIKNSIDIRFSTYMGSNNTNILSTETGYSYRKVQFRAKLTRSGGSVKQALALL